MEQIERSISCISLDSNCPSDYSEASAMLLGGDLHSKWGDKSNGMVVFENGRIGCAGEV